MTADYLFYSDFNRIFQVCQKIRGIYPEGLPIIMLSGNDDEASVLRGLEVSIKLKVQSFD